MSTLIPCTYVPSDRTDPFAVGYTGGQYAGDLVWGQISPVVSLATNVVATMLIAYPAWCVPYLVQMVQGDLK